MLDAGVREDGLMWTYLPLWLGQDGEVDELSPGSLLRGTALPASCRTVVTAESSPSSDMVQVEPEVDGFLYDVTGLDGEVRDVLTDRGDGESVRIGSEFLLTSGAMRFIARTADFPVDEVSGSTVTVRCSLHVMADYEADAFDLPDVREDWIVEAVQVERRVLARRLVKGLNGRMVSGGRAGDVVERAAVPRLRGSADDPPAAPDAAVVTTKNYVVDLGLVSAESQQA